MTVHLLTDANFIALKREVDALRVSRATVVTNG